MKIAHAPWCNANRGGLCGCDGDPQATIPRISSAPAQQVVFAVGRGEGDGAPTVILGVSREAWVYMKDGQTHTFDLTKAGVPVKIIMFGAKDRDEAKRLIMTGAGNKTNEPIIDAMDRDFAIKPKA